MPSIDILSISSKVEPCTANSDNLSIDAFASTLTNFSIDGASARSVGCSLDSPPITTHIPSLGHIDGGNRQNLPAEMVVAKRSTMEMCTSYENIDSPPTLNSGLNIMNPRDFIDITEIGAGFGGTIYKSIYVPTGEILARKVIINRRAIKAVSGVSAKLRKCPSEAELMTLQKSQSPYIVACKGIYVGEMQVSIAMEYMDMGSLDDILKLQDKRHDFSGNMVVLSHIAKSILNGLEYLHAHHRILHRDLKPANILLNSKGQVKLSDFGESVELVNSLARSLVGTMAYMAPERIRGGSYSIKSEVWSLGITLVELVTGIPPYESSPIINDGGTEIDHHYAHHQDCIKNHIKNYSVKLFALDGPNDTANTPTNSNGVNSPLAAVELWETILNDAPPKLDRNIYSHTLADFVERCLEKDEEKRAGLDELLLHPFIDLSGHRKDEIIPWCEKVLGLLERGRMPV